MTSAVQEGTRSTVSHLPERDQPRTGAGAGRPTTQDITLPRIEQTPRDGEPPLSYVQELQLVGYWLASLRGERVAAWVMPLRLRFTGPGPFDLAALERALNEVIRRHDVLRTAFPAPDGLLAYRLAGLLVMALTRLPWLRRGLRTALRARLFRQRILPEARTTITVTDLRGLSAQERQATLFRIALEDSRCPLDLAHPPLLRARLARVGDDDHLLFVAVSHLACDVWSLEILRRELTTLYACYAAGRESPLPASPLQYADFAAWERRTFQGPLLDRCLDAWRALVPDLRVLQVKDLPCAARPGPGTPAGARAMRELVIDPPVSAALRRTCAERRVTLTMLLFAATAVLFHRYTQKPRIAFFTQFANRLQPETQQVIGWFAQQHVLAVRMAASEPFTIVLERARDMMLGVYALQAVPPQKIRKALSPNLKVPAWIFTSPEIAFLHTPPEGGARSPADGAASVRIARAPTPTRHNDFALTIAVQGDPAGVRIQFHYARDWLADDAVEAMLDDLRVLLAACVAQPATAVGALPLARPPMTLA